MYYLATSKSKDCHRILYFENKNSTVNKAWFKDGNDKSYIMLCDDTAYKRGYSISMSFTIDDIKKCILGI